MLGNMPILPDDVLEELSDARFSGRRHYSRGTYAKKCRGPLCKKAERDRGRDRWHETQAAKGLTAEVIESKRLVDEDARLQPIIDWYLAQYATLKRSRS